jgi:hypothetical protein
MEAWEDQVVNRKPRPRAYRLPSSAKWIAREVMRGPGPLGGPLKELALLKREGLIRDYAIGGGVGTMRYTEPFTTLDLDVFYIPVKEDLTAGLPGIYAHLKERGILPMKEYVVIAGTPVQFLAVDALTREAVETAVAVEIEGTPTKVCSAEHLLALAVRTGRMKDRTRIQMLMEQGHIDRARLDGILKRHGLAKAFATFRKGVE